MNETFGSGASRWAALAAQYLGWPPDIFWRATPQELHTCLSDPQQSEVALISRDDIRQLLESDHNG